MSCYVNCVVQCLFSLPLFRTYLLRRVHSSKHKSGVIQSRKDCFLCELENACLRHMELPYSTSLAWISENVSSLTKTLALGMQEDAHEFLIAVLSCMEREATEAGRDPVGSDIAQMFGGWTCRLSECAACKHVETTYERYSVLSADVTNTTGTLTDSLRSLIAPEQIAGVTCASCKKSVKVSVRNMFASYPPVLIFHLKRFMEASRAKAECHVGFPERLDMTPYLLPSYAAPTKPGAESTAAAVGTSHFEYRLTGVVAHYGVTSFGHYVSYAVNSDGEWFMYSDDRVLEVPFSTVAAAQAYILFYQQANTELLGVPCCLKDGPLSESAPCLGGCGMFGTKENSYYCSVCFKKHFPNGKK